MTTKDYLNHIEELNKELRDMFYKLVPYYSKADEANFSLALSEIYSLSKHFCVVCNTQRLTIGKLSNEIKELKESYGQLYGKKMIEDFVEKLICEIDGIELEFKRTYFEE